LGTSALDVGHAREETTVKKLNATKKKPLVQSRKAIKSLNVKSRIHAGLYCERIEYTPGSAVIS
jgi:hypothetical protein